MIDLWCVVDFERRRAFEQQQLLIAELNHRVRNILALIRGLVGQSNRDGLSTEDFIRTMKAKIPMGRFVEVDEIAALVCWLASEDCSFSTGGVFDISGGRATY